MGILKYISIISLLSILFLGCGKEESRYTVPVSPVNFTINLRGLDNHLDGGGHIAVYLKSTKDKDTYDNLVGDNGLVKTFMGIRASGSSYLGHSGLLIINTASVLSDTPFAVFDLCCPHEDLVDVRVVPTKDGSTVKCPKCGAIYNILTGMGRCTNGISSENLQSYYIRRENENEYRIYYP